MYQWRQLTQSQRRELLAYRKSRRQPWHTPPHRAGDSVHYHVTAACYEHQPFIGTDLSRLAEFETALLDTLRRCSTVGSWCVLPNHYHCLVETTDILGALRGLGRLHGRSSWHWNGVDGSRGRKVWCNCTERALRSDRHFWATLNYIHNNPVHHGYVAHWDEWPFSSARDWIEETGRARALALWHEYPVLGYGRGWDDPQL